MNNKIKQILFMGFCILLVFNKITTYHFNIGSGLSVTNITSSSFDNYEGNRNTFSKASLVKTPHITFSIGHIFKTVYSPLTGSNDATFIIDAMFYGAWLKQAFKMVFQNDTNGSNNLYTLQDLEDIRVYFLGSYQLYCSIPTKSNSYALFLTTGIGLAFTLFNNLTFYESLTDAAIGNSLKGGHPITYTPYISLNWHYSCENSFFIKASYAFSYAHSCYKSTLSLDQPDTNASDLYKNFYLVNLTMPGNKNLPKPPKQTVCTHIFSCSIGKEF